MHAFAKGTKVRWNWGAHKGEGKVAEAFTRDVARTIKGDRIKRKASPGEPAYLIVQEDGDRVLKSHSELEKLS
jgi:hypothetical protein